MLDRTAVVGLVHPEVQRLFASGARVGRPRGAMAAAGAAALAVLAGLLAATAPRVAIVLVLGVVVLLVAAQRPALLAILAFPATAASLRLGGRGVGTSSVSDAVLLLAIVATLAAAPRIWGHLRSATIGPAVYLLLLLPGLVASPHIVALVEWAHRGILTLGALAVGAFVGSRGKAHVALKFYVAALAPLAVAAVIDSLTNGFAPAYPWGLHKNFLGGHLAAGLLILAAGAIPIMRGQRVLGWTLLGGLVATQSQGAIVALGVALIFVTWRDRVVDRRKLAMAVAIVGVGTVVGIARGFDVAEQASNRFSSIGSRIDFGRDAWDLFTSSPLLGRGIRYYVWLDEPGLASPHNVLLETLAESGILGAAGWIVLLVVTLRVLRINLNGAELGALAGGLLVLRAVHGFFDIYWVAGGVTLGWLVAGLALGAGVQDARSGRAIEGVDSSLRTL